MRRPVLAMVTAAAVSPYVWSMTAILFVEGGGLRFPDALAGPFLLLAVIPLGVTGAFIFWTVAVLIAARPLVVAGLNRWTRGLLLGLLAGSLHLMTGLAVPNDLANELELNWLLWVFGIILVEVPHSGHPFTWVVLSCATVCAGLASGTAYAWVLGSDHLDGRGVPT